MIQGINFDELCGERLGFVRELVLEPSDASSIQARQAVALGLGCRSLIVEALCDTSELRVSLGELRAEEPGHVVRDASHHEHFRGFIGEPLRGWWVGHNNRGYADAFMVAFAETRGLCFVAMNDRVSILTVTGEQWS